MMRSVLFALFFMMSNLAQAQVRLSKLTLAKGERYEIQNSDIAVIDTLVMGDSSTIALNWQKKDNFIHTKVFVVGKGCKILGQGRVGKSGRAGEHGAEFGGPCRAGYDGTDGRPGIPGGDGINLNLYITNIVLNGTLTIDLNGGSGGDGGAGGRGGNGSPGTKVCKGGVGGKGGNGGTGGNGGQAGNLLMRCKQCPDLRQLQDQVLFIKVYGGYPGIGGDGGTGGLAGLGPTRDGKNGSRGTEGTEGMMGRDGVVNFERAQ